MTLQVHIWVRSQETLTPFSRWRCHLSTKISRNDYLSMFKSGMVILLRTRLTFLTEIGINIWFCALCPAICFCIATSFPPNHFGNYSGVASALVSYLFVFSVGFGVASWYQFGLLLLLLSCHNPFGNPCDVLFVLLHCKNGGDHSGHGPLRLWEGKWKKIGMRSGSG